MRWLVQGAWLVTACGSSPTTTTTTALPPSSESSPRAEQVHKEALAAAHREHLNDQATALAATCTKPAVSAEAHCSPSCYPPELADARATGKKVRGRVKIDRLVCTRDVEAGPYLLADELGGKLAVRPARGRFPKPSKKGTWRATVEEQLAAALGPELARGDVLVVTGDWKTMAFPATQESLRCVNVSHYARSLRTLDGCGGSGKVACEATGNFAAFGLNLAHFRLAEARRLQASGNDEACQVAALDAIAVARGLPRWRQYVTLQVNRWHAKARYRTRFDGLLDEDALFARAAELGVEAEAVHVACGGAANPKTTAEQEHAFHSCAKPL